ncbi:MAG: SpoIIE family protein phosphatase [Oscillospiraceae bacterium]|jgi:serine phosphatase RsbU (regulator of sigma subunit)|nr:SpoIIE family protein phosphatase [Oscillospiraceae bacterium]
MNKEQKIAKKFRIFSAILFAVVFLASISTFIISSRATGYQAIKKSITLTAETAKLRLADIVNSQVLEVVKLANMPAIQNYFQNPTEASLKNSFDTELQAYKNSLAQGSDLFWVNDKDKIFYNTSSEPYVLDPDAPENYWYNMTLYETELYNFNVNYNDEMKKTGIWINVPVYSGTSFNDEPTPIGMLGTGIDISQFISDLHSQIDANAEIFVFNSKGEIMIAADLEAANKKENIRTLLGENGTKIYDLAMKADKVNPTAQLFESDGGFSGLGHVNNFYLTDYIPSVDWHIAVTYPVSVHTIYGNSMTTVFFIMLAVIALVLIISNIFMRFIDKALDRYITDFTKVTAEKERVATELNVATQIQTGMLPSIFPAFPERDEFDIYAKMLPAKEVGGDFYDFFLIDDNTLAVVIADVSGKGVPAALFMVIAKTLIKNNAQYGKSPKEVFETVNNILCENNEADMFVTCFMGTLNIKTGEFNFVNAGHNPPLIRKKGERGFEFLRSKPGFVLAGMPNMVYKENTINLSKGDELLLYTDGVTEAVDTNDELFGEKRLKNAIDSYKGGTTKEFLVSLKNKIDVFAGEAEQADDITMMILRYSSDLNLGEIKE